MMRAANSAFSRILSSPASLAVCLMVLLFVVRFGFAVAVNSLAESQAPGNSIHWVSEKLKGIDAYIYHLQALDLSNYWQGLSDNPKFRFPHTYLGYPVILALIYTMLGVVPMVGIFINCLAFVGSGLLAWRMAISLGATRKAALLPAVVVGLWPPSLLYSSLLMKDSLFIFATLAFLCPFLHLLAQNPDHDFAEPPYRQLLKMGLLGFGYLLVINLRPDFNLLCLATGLAGVGLGLLKGAWHRSKPLVIRCLLLLVLLAALAGVGSQFTLGKVVIQMARGGQAARAASAQPAVLPGNGPAWNPQAAARPNIAAMSAGGVFQALQSLVERVKLKLLNLRNTMLGYRWRYSSTGGLSLDEKAYLIPASISGELELVVHGLRNIWLFPYPWQQWPLGGGARIMGLLGVAQSLFWYALLPGIVVGLVRSFKRSAAPVLLLVFWCAIVGLVIMMVVTNLGTVYRHRDVVLLSIIPIIHAPLYGWLWNRPGRKRRSQPVQ